MELVSSDITRNADVASVMVSMPEACFWSLEVCLKEQRQDAAASFERPERATDTSPGQRAEQELRTQPWVQIPAGFSLSPKDLRFLEGLWGRGSG